MKTPKKYRSPKQQSNPCHTVAIYQNFSPEQIQNIKEGRWPGLTGFLWYDKKDVIKETGFEKKVNDSYKLVKIILTVEEM